MLPALFTTLRLRDGEAWFWERHLERLRAAPGLGLPPAPDEAHLVEEVAAAVGDLADARVRITLAQEGARVEAHPYAPPSRPWRIRPVDASPDEDTVRTKTTAREEYERARAAAREADDALLVGPDGACLETTIANLFFLTGDGRLVTPPAAGPLLAGIARGEILRRDVAAEDRVTLTEAAAARACVATNALFVAHPVAEIVGVARFASEGLARRLRETVTFGAPKTRIIQTR